ncbi:patj homolog isoform X1 [Microplitis demolitor]|uniref:patj homolog isoform X1 n=1 Tax=Microplitis demolitor TaxID=69319 RepID=UPI0004CD8A83|nr:patj homolog isoform X1 [Microplitis demolitor]XP_053593494.1 patj homolog isoform X1 [Microplitis demolitor]
MIDKTGQDYSYPGVYAPYISTALHVLRHISDQVKNLNSVLLHKNIISDIELLISLIEDPVFHDIVVIFDSLNDLNNQFLQHPSILPADFIINSNGQLEVSISNLTKPPVNDIRCQEIYQENSEVDDQRVPVVPSADIDGVITIEFHQPEESSLDTKVVGPSYNGNKDFLVFLQETQPNEISACKEQMREADRILPDDVQLLDSNIFHNQAISAQTKVRGNTESNIDCYTPDVECSIRVDEISEASTAVIGDSELLLCREHLESSGISENDWSYSSSVNLNASKKTAPPLDVIDKSPSVFVEPLKAVSDMVLNTEWAQVEVVNLVNDGTGLGFGIIGGKSTGVVVKTILPGGVADRDNRLQSGDHILQIGDVNLRGMGSEQVAAVLRQSGTHVRLVVARPIEPTSPDYQALESHAPIVPTKVLGDPEELNRHLLRNVPETYNIHCIQKQLGSGNKHIIEQESDFESHARPGLIMEVVRNPLPIEAAPFIPSATLEEPTGHLQACESIIEKNSLPETERFNVELKKDICGLGITIAGYVCEKEELSGIFVKSISKGSAAELSNKIQINDRIVKVNNYSLQGYSNHEAVEVLRNTGNTVHLCIERYLRGPKYEQLQQAIAASEIKLPQIYSPSITSLPSFSFSTDGDTLTEVETEVNILNKINNSRHHSIKDQLLTVDDKELFAEPFSSDSSDPTSQKEDTIKAKWNRIVGSDVEIIVAQITKFAEGSGLGISLEGTVDVENGEEVRPHHYIRSILPEGPVGGSGILRPGDELLEVNGHHLFGTNHTEVVSILKELPLHVKMVCGRKGSAQTPLCPINVAQDQVAFQTRSILASSRQQLVPLSDRLIKAKSEGSLTSITSIVDYNVTKIKSRSLEFLTGLATWNTQPQIVELIKGEKGLGFSVLDYQDPRNQDETVIIVRSLVPGGVAQTNGQLIPGDRILFVNNVLLMNATLDKAVKVLKEAPKGKVQLGIAKPSRIPDCYFYISSSGSYSNDIEHKKFFSVLNRKLKKYYYMNNNQTKPSQSLIHVTVFDNVNDFQNLVDSNTI